MLKIKNRVSENHTVPLLSWDGNLLLLLSFIALLVCGEHNKNKNSIISYIIFMQGRWLENPFNYESDDELLNFVLGFTEVPSLSSCHTFALMHASEGWSVVNWSSHVITLAWGLTCKTIPIAIACFLFSAVHLTWLFFFSPSGFAQIFKSQWLHTSSLRQKGKTGQVILQYILKIWEHREEFSGVLEQVFTESWEPSISISFHGGRQNNDLQRYPYSCECISL